MQYVRFTGCFSFLLCLTLLQVSGQELADLEMEMANVFQDIGPIRSDAEKLITGRHIEIIFQKIMEIPGSFQYPFDSVKNMGKIYSPDHQIRIYSWNIPMMDGTQNYYCYIQKLQDDQTILYKLHHVRNTKPDSISVYNESKWYGALYYDIIQKSCHGTTYYIVLGIDLNNYFTTLKIIDVIVFNNQEIILGAPVFRKGVSDLNRIIFEYSSRVSMMLRYLPEKDMIVFDHLSPHDPRYQGQYQYYGPDFSYDGFHFRDCRWIYQKDLDLRNALQ